MLGRRVGAVLAVSSAVLHALSLGHVTNPAVAVMMVAMIAGCLYCAYDLWPRGSVRAWVLVASMNLAMIAIHLPMSASHHHGGGGLTGAVPMPESAAMTLATSVAVVEVVLAAGVLWFRSRAWAPVATGPADVPWWERDDIASGTTGSHLDRLPRPR
jgi:hypothetical protein